MIYAVDDLEATAKALKRRCWKPEGESLGIPDGPCLRFNDPSGNEFAIFESTNSSRWKR